jgi:hypothetical protein
MKMRVCFTSLWALLLSTNLAFPNYVEVFFEGTIDSVDAGTKQIGEKIKGGFKYEFDAKGEFPSSSMTYPLQTNFVAFPLSMSIDGGSLGYHYGTSIHLVDWSEENREEFTVSSDGYLTDGNTNLRMECDFQGSDLFDSLFTLPNPAKFTSASSARFSFSLSIPRNLNAYQEKYSGVIENITTIVHPEGPEVRLLGVDEYGATVHFYGILQHSYDLKNWTDSALFLQSSSLHTYTFFEGAPKAFFVKATE